MYCPIAVGTFRTKTVTAGGPRGERTRQFSFNSGDPALAKALYFGLNRDLSWNRVPVLLVAAMFLAAILSHTYVWMQDYPDWVFEGTLFAKWLKGAADPAYVLKSYPVPDMATTLSLGVLDLVMPWQWSAKLFILVYTVFSYVCVGRFVKAAGQERDPWPFYVVMIIAVFGHVFWYGVIDYCLSVGLCFYACALFLEKRFNLINTALLSIVAFFTHAIGLTFIVFLVAYYMVREKKWDLIFSLVPSGCLTLTYLYG
jgi:hypothetical protein